MLLLSAILLAGLLPTADTCDSVAVSQARTAAYAYLRPFEPDDAQTTLHIGWADLNGDGRHEALVLVEGATWCGSGGCTLLVLEAMSIEDSEEEGPYRAAAEISLMHGPVVVSTQTSHQWRDLVLHPDSDEPIVLHFDGETYPYSPIDGVPSRKPIAEFARLFADTR